MKTILAGKIVKPQGIKGEVKILPYIDKPSGFCTLKEIFIDNKIFPIITARVNGSDVFLLLEGIADRNTSEEFRGKEVYVRAEDAKELKTGEYFYEEIIGLEAYVGEVHIGVIKDIYPNRGADVLIIQGEKEYMVPFLNRAVTAIDIANGRMVFEEKAFKEIVYED
ncbi:MAG: 16S rRNA processing protein RimM [Clostridia bacterium]|nr:16S rRNA processing protein RimM [Clostridia bacterium]